LRSIVHAAIDVDSLGLAALPTASGNDEVMYSNLRSVCANYASLDVTRFLLARALESRAELDLYRVIVLTTDTISVSTEDHSRTEVAPEMLVRAGWI
jgi:hypothetical protein